MILNVEFRPITCSCGFTFAIPEKWAMEREADHGVFYCPKCECPRHYPQESSLEKAEREARYCRNRLESEVEEKEQISRRLRSTKGVITRMKKRALGEGE